MHLERRYGSYEMSFDPGFDRNKLSLIDRGFTYAIAHIRGGGDMGRHWYEDGKFLKKKNTFTDFVAVAEHLIAHKYTSPGKLCIEVRATTLCCIEGRYVTHICAVTAQNDALGGYAT